MNTKPRRVILVLIATLAAYVGLWAAAFPRSFYDSFPGAGLTWISTDGPFNEHLIRDVGALYLGFAAASIAAAVSHAAAAGRVVGIGWTLFCAIHLAYHLVHLDGSLLDRIGNVIGLGVSLALGILLLPTQRATITTEVAR